tara:strand:- start:83 stop:583 length:501 start_codon:yes stop_codon:yes gene_type:complete
MIICSSQDEDPNTQNSAERYRRERAHILIILPENLVAALPNALEAKVIARKIEEGVSLSHHGGGGGEVKEGGDEGGGGGGGGGGKEERAERGGSGAVSSSSSPQQKSGDSAKRTEFVIVNKVEFFIIDGFDSLVTQLGASVTRTYTFLKCVILKMSSSHYISRLLL